MEVNRIGLRLPGQFEQLVGGIALADLLAGENPVRAGATPGVLAVPHHPAKAKRVIYLFQSGGPSQLETFDYKPLLNEKQGQQLPDSVRMGQRLTGMSGNQATLPLAGSIFKFQQHGQSGAWICDLLPHTAKIVNELCIVRSMYTEAINHDPAITFLQTGSQISGRYMWQVTERATIGKNIVNEVRIGYNYDHSAQKSKFTVAEIAAQFGIEATPSVAADVAGFPQFGFYTSTFRPKNIGDGGRNADRNQSQNSFSIGIL